MKLTKQRKVYIAVLGLAAAAFIADRMMFEPAGAGAATVAAPTTGASAESAPQPGATGSAPAAKAEEGPSLAQKLSLIRVTRESDRDPFNKPWMGVIATKREASGRVSAATPEEFEKLYELKAVSTNQGRSIAVIGRRSGGASGAEDWQAILVAGSSEQTEERVERTAHDVDGWRLVKADKWSATLDRDGQRVTLTLKGFGGDNSKVSSRSTGMMGPPAPSEKTETHK